MMYCGERPRLLRAPIKPSRVRNLPSYLTRSSTSSVSSVFKTPRYSQNDENCAFLSIVLNYTHACLLAIILCMGVAMLQFTFSSSLVSEQHLFPATLMQAVTPTGKDGVLQISNSVLISASYFLKLIFFFKNRQGIQENVSIMKVQ